MGNNESDENDNKESEEEEEEEDGGGGSRRCQQCKIRGSKEGGEYILARQTYQEVKHSDQTDQDGDVIRSTLVGEVRGGWERSYLQFLTPIHTQIRIGF